LGEHEHPNLEVRDALTPPYIQSTKPGDPQPKPPGRTWCGRVRQLQMSDQAELDFLVEHVQAWLEKKLRKYRGRFGFLNDRVLESQMLYAMPISLLWIA
jgi:hypothetical protein